MTLLAPAIASETSAYSSSGTDGIQIVEGDILQAQRSTQALQQDPRFQRRGMGLRGDRSPWADGVVPYMISTELAADSIAVIQEAIEHWNEVSGISLLPLHNLAGSQQYDFLHFQPGPGCASWVGRQGGEQEVWIAPSCSAGSVMHEIGHSLGLEHEHTRPDRDQYIVINRDNIDPEKAHNFDTTEYRSRELGAYDYASIMHYGPRFFSHNGLETITPLGSQSLLFGQSVSIGQRNAPSVGDINAVAQLYASDLSLTTRVVSEADTLTEITLYVTNQHTQGAHQLVLTVPTMGRHVLSQTDNAWRCSSALEQVICRLDRLAGGADSTLTITLDGPVAAADVLAEIHSKTPDANLGNNGTGGTVSLPPTAAAAQATYNDDSSSNNRSGTGASSIGLPVLLIFIGLRRAGWRRDRYRTPAA
jgi:hypothetical protein